MTSRLLAIEEVEITARHAGVHFEVTGIRDTVTRSLKLQRMLSILLGHIQSLESLVKGPDLTSGETCRRSTLELCCSFSCAKFDRAQASDL